MLTLAFANFRSTFRSLNLFRYITFRTGGAIDDGAAFRLLLRAEHHRCACASGRARASRSAPTARRRIFKKSGHADHGRPDDLVGPHRLDACSGQIFASVYVWIVLLVTLGFGAIGFYDDYLKVTKQIA